MILVTCFQTNAQVDLNLTETLSLAQRVSEQLDEVTVGFVCKESDVHSKGMFCGVNVRQPKLQPSLYLGVCWQSIY